MESAKEINITYETLFEVVKRERDLADLQKLEQDFFKNFIEYLNEKKKMLEKEDSLFSYDEKKKVEKQIDNARRMIKELYERREKKILSLAVIKSRTKSNIMDVSSLLDSEKKLLEDVENVLDSFRKKILYCVMEGRNPELSAVERCTDGFSPDAGKKEPEKKDVKLVRFLCPVPKFVGKDLEEYGPFTEEDIANLPAEIADLLIGKERVEEIHGS